MDGCPVEVPKLISVQSTVIACSHCGAWVVRYPSFMGEFDDFFQCEKCGCSAIKIRDGRPYSHRSRRWDWVVGSFKESFTDIPYWDWNTVVCDPPLKELDWDAIEQWYQEHNIYRIFIGAPDMTIEQDGNVTHVIVESPAEISQGNYPPIR